MLMLGSRLHSWVARAAAIAALMVVGAVAPADAETRRVIGAIMDAHPDGGARVISVQKGFPAAVGGLQPGDRVLAAGDTAVADPDALSAALSAGSETAVLLQVSRPVSSGYATVFVGVRPWRAPDAALDAALFAYPEAQSAEAAEARRARFSARLGGRDYALLDAGRVFNLEGAIGLRSFAPSETAAGDRVAFRARVARCSEILHLSEKLYEPGAGLFYSQVTVRSLLFDFETAGRERAACDAYFEERSLELSNPVVMVTGRFVRDPERRYTESGELLLVDQVFFDNRHVTFMAQIAEIVRVADGFGLLSP